MMMPQASDRHCGSKWREARMPFVMELDFMMPQATSSSAVSTG